MKYSCDARCLCCYFRLLAWLGQLGSFILLFILPSCHVFASPAKEHFGSWFGFVGRGSVGKYLWEWKEAVPSCHLRFDLTTTYTAAG